MLWRRAHYKSLATDKAAKQQYLIPVEEKALLDYTLRTSYSKSASWGKDVEFYEPIMTTNRDLQILRQGEIRLLSLEHGSTSKNLRYILQRVQLVQAPVYHALSYCWGAAVPDSSLKTITVDGELKTVRRTLYSFLKEMAANGLGISLWIDSLCINQNSVAERNQQVSIMADIYRSAESVYVWLGRGDEDTDYALEHIQGCNPRTEYVSLTFSECVEKLFMASYWRRRWVIQEFALAKRLVIACGKQQATWDQVTKKFDKSGLLENGTAWKTLRSFEDARDAGKRKDFTLFQLLKQFQHSQCMDRRDRAYALRGIAEDGQHLMIKYNESVGDLYFRLLSMLPTEWILPVMAGYRWPHQAAKELIMLIKLTKDDLLNSLLDGTKDLLFTVFEYVGTVVNVEERSQGQIGADDCGAFFSCSRRVQIRGSTTRHVYGRKPFKVGDVVYTLQSTSQSPKGLYIVLASDRAHRSVVGLLFDETRTKTVAYWQRMQLTEQRMIFIEDTLIYGVTRCDRNISVENSCRVLCHIKRRVLILLWLLDIGQLEYLYDRKPSFANPEAEKDSLCYCLQGLTHTLRPSEQNTASRSCNLEILPNFPTLDNDERWKAASIAPWSLSIISPLLEDHELHGQIWEAEDAEDFRAHGRTQLSYAARDGHVGFVINLLSKLDVSASRRGDATQKALLLYDGDNYSGAEEPPFNSDKVNPDTKDEYGRTPLSYAARGGHEAVVKLLVEREDVAADSKDHYSQTPLSHSAGGGHEAVVKLLVERDDVAADSKDQYSQTPLSHAAEGGHEAVVKLLVERDDVAADSKDQYSQTPLSHAAEGGHEAVVKLLVKRDDVAADSKDSDRRTPLSYAAAGGHEAVVKLLVERDDVAADSKDGSRRTPLSHSAGGGHEAVVKLLVERDDVAADSKDHYSQTPLSHSAGGGHEAVVKLLVERDDVAADLKDQYSQTPLSHAAEGGHEAVVKLLVKRDDVAADSKDSSRRTPLSHAAEGGHEAVVKLLVKREDVAANSKDSDRRTPLLYAAAGGHEAVVKLLVERDDVAADLKDQYSQTPLSHAAASGHEAVVKLLVKRDDVAADSQDSDRWTPLSHAAAGGHEAVVKLLVKRDDVAADSKDKYSQTPLSHAAASGHEAVVKLLVERNDVAADSKDSDRRTPLSYAAAGGHEAVVKLLVERDDVAADSKDDENRTPLSRAERAGHEAVVKLLRSKYSQITNYT